MDAIVTGSPRLLCENGRRQERKTKDEQGGTNDIFNPNHPPWIIIVITTRTIVCGMIWRRFYQQQILLDNGGMGKVTAAMTRVRRVLLLEIHHARDLLTTQRLLLIRTGSSLLHHVTVGWLIASSTAHGMDW